MGLIERVAQSRTEKRIVGGTPFMPWTDPYMPFNVGGPVHPTRQIFGPEKALALPALYAGAKILSDDAASLPLRVYSKTGGSRLVPYDGPSLFDNPSVLGTSYDWIFTCMSSLVLQGNAWGLITGRDGFGYPTGIEWIPTHQVFVEEDEQQPLNPLRTKVFAYGRELTWHGPDAQLFHVKGFAMAGKLEGISPLRAHAITITSGLEAAEFGLTWFENGGFPIGTFQNSEMEVDADQANEIKRTLINALRTHQPLVYGRDWDYTPVTVPPSEAQFLESMQYTATQIAAILDLPPNRLGGKSGDSLTYNTVEQNQLQVIESLRPWLVRLERKFSLLLPMKREARFNTDALLKTDLKTRTEIYQIQRNIGLRTTDELRELEDLPPLPGGAGNESLPLTLMVSMAQRAGALPKSMLDQVVLLIDIAGKKLENLQKKGITKEPPGGDFPTDPDTGAKTGPANSPGAFYANMLNSYSRELSQQGQVEAAAMVGKYAQRLWAEDQLAWQPETPLKELVENMPELPSAEE